MPLLTINNITSGYNASRLYFDQFPGLLTITLVDGFLSAALTVFSIYAGISLWKKKPGAVTLAKKYLLAFLGYAVIAAVLPFMAGLPSEANSAMVPGVIRDAVRSLIYVAVWYSYLSKSVRVKATYGSLNA
jgi:hypothetical protein